MFTQPTNVQVRFMNIGQKYQVGMALQYGCYNEEVSAPGYRTLRPYIQQTSLNWDDPVGNLGASGIVDRALPDGL